MQNRDRQRNRKQRPDAENRSDTVMLTAAPFKIWDTLKQFHPHKKEILNVVRILNSLAFYGSLEWTEEDVKGLLEGYRALQ
jgi:hypothetical protein